MVYGHTDYAGIHLRSLSVEREITQVLTLMMTLRSTGVPQQLAVIALNWAQHLAGVDYNILSHPHTLLPHLEPMKWIPAIRTGLANLSCTMEIPEIKIPQLQRENNFFLVTNAMTHSLKPTELQMFNACRLYLGVTLMSDICSANGTHLSTRVLHGQRPDHNTPKLLYPYQSKPSIVAWKIWRSVLTSHLWPDTTQLKHPLGRWFVTGIHTTRRWSAYLDTTNQSLYIPDGNRFKHYSHTPGGYSPLTTLILPSTTIPTDLIWETEHPHSLGHRPAYPTLPIHVPSSFQQFIHSLAPWEEALLENASFLFSDVFSVVHHITSCLSFPTASLLLATNGSVTRGHGSFGLVLSLSDGTRLLSNNGPALGYRLNSYRAECYGLLSGLSLLLRMFEYTSTTIPDAIQIHTDSESMILKLRDMLTWPYSFPSSTMTPEWDVLQAIVTLLHKFPAIPTISHVKGHQDANSVRSTLTLPALLNIKADALAAQYTYPSHINPSEVFCLPGNSVQLHSRSGTITSKYRNVLRRLASEPSIQQYICSKNNWYNSTFTKVDWESHGTAVRLWHPHRRFLTKYIHDWLPLGKLISKYNPSYPTACPSCATILEDREHFLCCTARPWQALMFTAFPPFLHSLSTSPVLSEIIISSLRQWFLTRTVDHPSHSRTYTLLLADQSAIGWDQLLFGRFSSEWAMLQDDYIQHYQITNKLARNGSQWVVKVIDFLWKYIYSAWQTRNNARHGADSTTQETAKYEQARRETELLYELANQVLPRDRDVFYPSLAHHFQQHNTSTKLRQWLNIWQPLILRSVQLCSHLCLTRNHSIREFFTPVP